MKIQDAISKYNIESSEDELIEACQYGIFKEGLNPTESGIFLNYILGILSLKQQKEMVDDQNKASGNLVKVTWVLAIATWILAIATIILVLVTKK
jgi:hypothetical protein